METIETQIFVRKIVDRERYGGVLKLKKKALQMFPLFNPMGIVTLKHLYYFVIV